MTVRLFITGTDTDVGKTQVSLLLLEAFKKRGLSTAVLKPVAAGAKSKNGKLQNRDAELLKMAATADQSYAEINPSVFEAAIAPHLAANQQGVELSVKSSMCECKPALSRAVDVLLVEGAGGWLVPLNSRESMADLAQAMQGKVVLVVGLRLGCISHALLSAASIKASGLEFIGWVANQVDEHVQFPTQIVTTLEQQLEAPLIGQIPYSSDLNGKLACGSGRYSAQISPLVALIDTTKII